MWGRGVRNKDGRRKILKMERGVSKNRFFNFRELNFDLKNEIIWQLLMNKIITKIVAMGYCLN